MRLLFRAGHRPRDSARQGTRPRREYDQGLPAPSDGPTIVRVSATVRTGAPPGAAVVTLGNLLYADKSKVRIPETEWVGLVQAVAMQDQKALQSLYGRTHRIVFTLIMRIVNDRGTAEELTLDVFHDVWKRAGRYDPSAGTVVGWIMNQARCRAIDRVRFEHRKKRTDPRPHDANADRTMGGGEQAALEGEERIRALRNALSAVLTAKEREAIETAFFGECTYADVAARLNQPLGTVKTRIRSGMEKLRQALAMEPV